MEFDGRNSSLAFASVILGPDYRRPITKEEQDARGALAQAQAEIAELERILAL